MPTSTCLDGGGLTASARRHIGPLRLAFISSHLTGLPRAWMRRNCAAASRDAPPSAVTVLSAVESRQLNCVHVCRVAAVQPGRRRTSCAPRRHGRCLCAGTTHSQPLPVSAGSWPAGRGARAAAGRGGGSARVRPHHCQPVHDHACFFCALCSLLLGIDTVFCIRASACLLYACFATLCCVAGSIQPGRWRCSGADATGACE